MTTRNEQIDLQRVTKIVNILYQLQYQVLPIINVAQIYYIPGQRNLFKILDFALFCCFGLKYKISGRPGLPSNRHV